MNAPAMSMPKLPEQLPKLRDDLHLREATPHSDGSPGWTVQDPVSNAFFKIGWLEFEFLARWHVGSAAELVALVDAQTPLKPTSAELLSFIHFLQNHSLLQVEKFEDTDQLIKRHRLRSSTLSWLLHHYLFFRIPLWRPQRWRAAVEPSLSWIYRKSTAWVLLALSLLGMLLVARQWDTFTASLADTFSPSGLAAYLIALMVTKSLHEMGHALTATRYGVRVAHMGVAFIVLWPMLYTDTSESWKLKDQRQRLAISSAGIVTELTIAAATTLLWALMEPGDVRQALFYLATTSWVLTLGLNASPFMRFDGYFILSDLLDFPNLHDRSTALAKTWLRRHLLGWKDNYPESFDPGKRRLLIVFALITWIYRLTVFLGIAVAVYFMFFKLLGIVLFLVEILWFIVRPVAAELKVWRERSGDITAVKRSQALWTGLALLFILVVPWNNSVSAQAYAHSENSHVIYSPVSARLVAIHARPGPVSDQDVLIELDQPEVGLRERVAQTGAAALDSQLAGLAAIPQGEERRLSLLQQRAVKNSQLEAEEQEAARLKLHSPFSGVITDMDPELSPGVWVSQRHALGVVIQPDRWVVEAFVEQRDLLRLTVGSAVRFYPQDQPLASVKGTVTEIDHSRVSMLPHILLSAKFGGQLPVLEDHGGLTPRDVLYRVRVRLEQSPDGLALHRGTVNIEASPQSWLLEKFTGFLSALVREASF